MENIPLFGALFGEQFFASKSENSHNPVCKGVPFNFCSHWHFDMFSLHIEVMLILGCQGSHTNTLPTTSWLEIGYSTSCMTISTRLSLHNSDQSHATWLCLPQSMALSDQMSRPASSMRMPLSTRGLAILRQNVAIVSAPKPVIDSGSAQ